LAGNSSTKFNTDRSIFKKSLQKARMSMGSDYFLLILMSDENRHLELYGDAGIDRETARILLGELKMLAADSWASSCSEGPACYYAEQSGNPLATRLLENTRSQCLIIMPFLMDDHNFGFGCWLWRERRAFNDDDPKKAALLADLLELSVKAYQNKKRARERGDKLAALLELSTSIYSSRNFTEVLQKAVRLAMQIMGADGGSIFTIDKNDMLLRPLVIIDEKYEEELSSMSLKLGEGVTGSVAQSGVGIISNYSNVDPRSIQVPGTPVERESLLSAPLTWSGEVIGAMTLWNYAGKDFSREELEILTIFARQTADAIENAKLFESLEKAYEELSATQERLIMAEKLQALGDMAGGVAHDFNNVLGTILGRAQLLLRKIAEPDLRKDLQIIEEVSLRGRRTVQRLQDFTHVSSRTEYGPIDLNKVIEDVIEVTKPAWKDTVQRAGLTINLHRSSNKIEKIDGSHEELKEAFCNIVLNSVDALPNGGNIWVDTFMDDEQVVLRIRDDGVGMDEDTKNKLFFPFFTTKGKKGVGMGLAVVYGIMFRHHADINVESLPGEGATFTFRFNPSHSRADRILPVADESEDKPVSILLVDDDTNLLDVVGDMIEFLGMRCVKADGGRTALKLMQDQTYDLVITDLGMPDVGGWDVAKFCRDNHANTPVLLISGWGAQLNTEEALGRVDAILPKPFQLDELKQAIEAVMRKTRRLDLSLIDTNNELTSTRQ
jgi:signal transduction histidine kinase/ActR/RegA family two-component response regulator